MKHKDIWGIRSRKPILYSPIHSFIHSFNKWAFKWVFALWTSIACQHQRATGLTDWLPRSSPPEPQIAGAMTNPTLFYKRENCLSGRFNNLLKIVPSKRQSPDSSRGLSHHQNHVPVHRLDFPPHVRRVLCGACLGTDRASQSSKPCSLPLGVFSPWSGSLVLIQLRLKLIQNIWKRWVEKNLTDHLIWMNPVSRALGFTSLAQEQFHSYWSCMLGFQERFLL